MDEIKESYEKQNVLRLLDYYGLDIWRFNKEFDYYMDRVKGKPVTINPEYDSDIKTPEDIVKWLKENSMDGRDFSKAKGQTAYRNTYWNPFMEALGFNKRDIHETRYTCISKLEDAEIYQARINRIVGHTGKTVAENVYTQLDIQGLIEAINKI